MESRPQSFLRSLTGEYFQYVRLFAGLCSLLRARMQSSRGRTRVNNALKELIKNRWNKRDWKKYKNYIYLASKETGHKEKERGIQQKTKPTRLLTGYINYLVEYLSIK